MFTGLSLDQAPPFEAPLKFFLTAPIFGIIFGVLGLFLTGLDIHTPNLIATIHILTLGYMVMIIFGALQQMLPVVAGAVIPRAVLTANITYGLLMFGIVSFAIAFVIYEKAFFFTSAMFLLAGVGLFTIIALKELLKVENKSHIVKGMILSLIFFIFAFLLGVHLLISHATTNIGIHHYDFATLHYNYVFFGFMYLLIASITIQVVPMFWVTDSFKENEQKIFIYIPTILLIAYTVCIILNINIELIYKVTMGITILYFAYVTINKLKSRKRKLKDITVYFYTTSMIFLILGIIYLIASEIFSLNLKPVGILLGLGFIVSLINGMLYKIVPFLAWFHLSSKGVFNIPTMRDMIPVKNTQRQFYFHLSATILFCIYSLLDNEFILYISLIIFIISNILFFINLMGATKVYLKNKND